MAELPEDVYKIVQAHIAAGDALVAKVMFREAIVDYWSAWNFLPEPKTVWQAAT